MANGVILAYTADVLAGVIAGDDGKTYYFTRNDWSSPEEPATDMPVTFDPGERSAKNVRVAGK